MLIPWSLDVQTATLTPIPINEDFKVGLASVRPLQDAGMSEEDARWITGIAMPVDRGFGRTLNMPQNF